MEFLKDDWMIQGTTLAEFEEKLRDFSNNTEVKKRNMNEFQFLNVTDIGSDLIGIPLDPKSLWKQTKASMTLKKFPVNQNSVSAKYDAETTAEAFTNGLFVMFSKKKFGPSMTANNFKDGKYCPISEKALNTIANRIKFGGSNFSKPCLVRDLTIANYFSKPVPVYTIERTDPDSGSAKIFAVMSNKYTHIEQDMLLIIIKHILEEAKRDLGAGVCNDWYIDHSITRVYIDFEEYASQITKDYGLPDEMVPGIMIETSDIGDCSLRIKGYFRLGGNLTYMEKEFSQIHSGELDLEKLLITVSDHIFPEYRIYPEKLANLMLIDLVDSTMSKAQKIKTMTMYYRDISKKIGLVKAIGKKREKALIDQLILGINPEIDYTAYDVAETFLTLSSTLVIENRSVVDSVSKVVRNVLDYEFKEDIYVI
jgi:hypothetical protein